jgi:hypothetical protein
MKIFTNLLMKSICDAGKLDIYQFNVKKHNISILRSEGDGHSRE